jgi:hypothetical protein
VEQALVAALFVVDGIAHVDPSVAPNDDLVQWIHPDENVLP